MPDVFREFAKKRKEALEMNKTSFQFKGNTYRRKQVRSIVVYKRVGGAGKKKSKASQKSRK